MVKRGNKMLINISVEIPNGWRINYIDLSMSPRAVFVRDSDGYNWWHSLSEQDQEMIPLYISGFGVDMESAIKDGIKEIERLSI